ncbi:hypothetical protein [Cellulomonas sp. ICMP 17802]|uniref:hypothetical protein n=1 Tax=Cellulomonas sp. ICMP 17802 TaxID=3239199 RepID=UPI00351B95B3
MRAVRGRLGAIVALLVAAGLALSALAGLTWRRSLAIPADGPWQVVLRHPAGGWSACLDDASVATTATTDDLPASYVTADLASDATVRDVRRVAECLSGAMTGGTIQVVAINP